MPWSLNLHPDDSIVETVYAGRLTKAERQDAVQSTLRVAQQQQRTRLLADCTALQGGHTTGDLYFLAQAVAQIDHVHLLKEAVVYAPLTPSQDLSEFWQITALNRGFQVRCFDQRQLAIDWLLQD